MITMPIYYPTNYNYPNTNLKCCCQNQQPAINQPVTQQPAVQQPYIYQYPQMQQPAYYPSVNVPYGYMGGMIMDSYNMAPNPFIFTADERQYLKDNPNKSITDFLVKNKNFKRAVEYVDSNGEPKNLPVLQKYFNNPSFESLVNSKFAEGETNFVKLVDIIYKLDKSQSDAYKQVNSPNYRVMTIPDMNTYYANISVDNCIKNLDNFFKSEKISDDLKKYILQKTDILSDLWFVGTTLGDKNLTVDSLIYPRMAF